MRVLFGYDGSAPADQACDLIAGIDWPPETGLRVVTAYQLLVPGSGWPGEIVDGATAEAIFEADRVFAEGRARAVAERIRRPGLTVTWTALIGRPASAVLDEAAARPIDLLVVGSRGLGPFTAALLGSVSAELVDHAPCPVLVARGRTVERVILAEDGSPGAEAAAVVLAWPIFARSRVRVVTVYEAEGRGGLAPTATSEAAASARSRLVERGLAASDALARGRVDRLTAAGLTAEIDVRHGDPAHEIVRAAADWKADLIVMGTRGQTGLERLLVGSVARKVLHHAPCSVLIARSPAS